MPSSSRCRNYRKDTDFVVRTVCRFAVRDDVGIVPYNDMGRTMARGLLFMEM